MAGCLVGRLCIVDGGHTSLSHGLCWEPGTVRTAWLHEPLPLQDSASPIIVLKETTALLVHCFFC